MDKEWTIYYHNGECRKTQVVTGTTKTHAKINWEKSYKTPVDTFIKLRKKN